MIKRALLVVVLLAGGSCIDLNGPDGPEVRVSVVSRYVGARPLGVTALAESFRIDGGPGLTAGIARASAQVSLTGQTALTVLIRIEPDCCFDEPVSGEYTALVTHLPGGWYDVEVRQRYWTDRPDVILATRLFIPAR